MSDLAIRVQNPCKQYPFGTFGRAGCIGAPQARYRTLRDTLTDTLVAFVRVPRTYGTKKKFVQFVQFVAKKRRNHLGPQRTGIGRNGAGKSAFKILSRITEPTEGRAETLSRACRGIHGRVGSLLEACPESVEGSAPARGATPILRYYSGQG